MADNIMDVETISQGGSTLTVGLLGVDVSDLFHSDAGIGVFRDCVSARRLDEVERRILLIEEQLRALNEVVQP